MQIIKDWIQGNKKVARLTEEELKRLNLYENEFAENCVNDDEIDRLTDLIDFMLEIAAKYKLDYHKVGTDIQIDDYSGIIYELRTGAIS